VTSERRAPVPASHPRPLAGLTLMAVLAHPDDEALACGGTLARAADAGAAVVVVCASRGEMGSLSDPALAPDGDLGRARALELSASAAELGVGEVVLLDHPDGSLRWADGLGEELAALLRRVRPQAVITFDADGLYWHPDHVGVHEWTTRAVLLLGAEAPALYYVTLPAGAVRGLCEAAHARGGSPPGAALWGISPDAFGALAPPSGFRVDVRDQAARKLAALRHHHTQAGAGSPFRWASEEDARAWLGVELFRRAPTATAFGDVLEHLADGAGDNMEGGAREASGNVPAGGEGGPVAGSAGGPVTVRGSGPVAVRAGGPGGARDGLDDPPSGGPVA